jgi:hypothetical protein
MAMKCMQWVPAFALALALPWVVQANGSDSAVAKQVNMAAAHAGMAAGAADLKTAHAHLQHVINCLVGPSGAGYNAEEANPCQGMGQGAIVDAKGDSDSHAASLQAAVDEAQQGLKTTTLSAAHADAQKVVSSLQAK